MFGAVIMGLIIINTIAYIIISRNEKKKLNTQVEQQYEDINIIEKNENSDVSVEESESEEEPYYYTDEELEEIRDWILEREEFKETGKIPNLTNWRLRFGTALSAGLVAEFFCFLPGMGIWLYGNMLSVGVFKQMSMANPIIAQLPNTGNTEGFMLLLLSIAIVFFAIIGLASCVVWFSYMFRDDYYDVGKWYENEIEKSEEMCEAALQEAEKPLKEEIASLQEKLRKSENERDYYQAEKESNNDVLKQEKEEVEKALSQLQEEYSREKRIWNLEKRELELELKQYKRK